MKIPSCINPSARFRAFALAIMAMLASASAQAATFTWDPTLTTTGSDGPGNWDDALWASEGVDTNFVSLTDAAVVRNVTTQANTGSTTLIMNDVTGLLLGQEFSLAQFPIGTVITDITGNTITLSNASTAQVNAATNNVNFQFARNNAIVGSSISLGGTINLESAQNVRNLTINEPGDGSYTFTGSALNIGSVYAGAVVMSVNWGATFNNVVNGSNPNNNRLQFTTADQALTFTGGGTILAMGNGGGIFGTNSALAQSSTVNVTGGTYTGTFGLWNIGNPTAETGGMRFSGATTISNILILQIGNTGPSFLSISAGAKVAPIDQVSIGRSTNNIGKAHVDGGIFTANGGATNQAMVQVGRGSGVGTLKVTNGSVEVIGNGLANTGGGVVVLNSENTTTATAIGTLDVSGGTMTIKDLRFNGTNQHQQNLSSTGSAILNLSGGNLYIGGTVFDNISHNASGTGGVSSSNFTTQGGISNRGVGTSTYAVNLSVGTLGANANWSSNLNMNLLSGTTTFKTANAADAPFNITLSGALSGSGGVSKTGDGILTLSGANSYAGNTAVSDGTLVLGQINLNNESSTVTIASDATLQLDFAGTDTVGQLVIGTDPPLADNIYGKLGSTAPIVGISQISGDGTLTVGSVSTGNYASWAIDNDIPGEAALDDFDNDGLSNLVEYALGKDPTVSSQPAGTFSGNVITFTKGDDASANNDVIYEIEVSTDLGILDEWETMVTGGTEEEISYDVSTGGNPKHFARLKVTQVP